MRWVSGTGVLRQGAAYRGTGDGTRHPRGTGQTGPEAEDNS
jgi:hypothetical protein